jgi:hypothetical protein
MLLPDLPITLPVALIPSPSLLIFIAMAIVSTGVLSLAIGVPLRSLNLLRHSLPRYRWMLFPPDCFFPFLTTRLFSQCMQFISLERIFSPYSITHPLARQCLIGRTFTFINQVVQLTFIVLVGVVIYGLITEIHTQRIALGSQLKN